MGLQFFCSILKRFSASLHFVSYSHGLSQGVEWCQTLVKLRATQPGVLKLTYFFKGDSQRLIMKSFPSWHLHVLGGGFCCFIQWMEEENFSRIVKGRFFFWNGLKGTIQKYALFHLLLKKEKISGNLTEASGVCSQPFPAVLPWKCSFSFTVSASHCNYSFPALSLSLQHNLH